jgi:hypothetical protein
MVNLRSALATAVSTALSALPTCKDFHSTTNADSKVLLGQEPVSDAIVGIGDWRVVSREAHSWNRNKVENELDILFYFRDPDYFADYDVDEDLQSGLSLSDLGSASYQVINAAVSEAEPQEELHDNIWRRRFVFSCISIETRT